MSDALKILRQRLDDLIGPGKPFKSAPEMAQRASTMGVIDSVPNFTRSINRVRKGATDVQLSTIEAIAKTANVTVSDLLMDEIDGPAKAAAELVATLDAERATSALAMLRGLSTAPPRPKPTPVSPKDVLNVLMDMRNQIAHGMAPPALLDPSAGTGEFLLTAMRFVDQLESKRALEKSVADAFEAWLGELLAKQKSVDTSRMPSDATHLINQTRAAALGKPDNERGNSADEESRQRPTIKYR